MKTKLLAPGILVIAALLAFTGVAHASGERHHHRPHNEHNVPSPESPPSPPSEAEPAPPVEQPVAAPEPQPPVERDLAETPPTEASTAAGVEVSTEVKLK